MEIESAATQIPSFTFYPITTADIKTCYQSKYYKMFCSVNGPYFQRKAPNLDCIFNIKIVNCEQNHSQNSICPQQTVKLQQKIVQVLENIVQKKKYERMYFDINFQIIERNSFQPSEFLLPRLLNLLSYTCILKGLEIQTVFACSAVFLQGEKIFWQKTQKSKNQNLKYMILAIENKNQRSLLLNFEGQFNYGLYEKLTGVLMESNLQICKFITQKANEMYEVFHQ